jgi:nitrogen regulatory protein P-II 2
MGGGFDYQSWVVNTCLEPFRSTPDFPATREKERKNETGNCDNPAVQTGRSKEELYKAEVNLLTVSEVMGHGRQKGVTEIYRGAQEAGNLLKKIRLEIAVNDNFLEPTVKAIIKGAKTGETGDGKIFILDLKECVRIRTEERGSAAIW